MRTKNIATVSAVVLGLTTVLMSGTALSQATTPAEEPILEQDQTQTQGDTLPADGTTGAQTGTGTAQDSDPLAPDTGVAEDSDPLAPDTGVAEDSDPMAPDTGVAEDSDPMAPDTGIAEDSDPTDPDTGVAEGDTMAPGTGMAADDPLQPRRSVTGSTEPYVGDVLAGLTADELIGMDVIDATGDNVGSISDLLFGGDDRVEHAIIDVGGFLGFGAKSVAIPLTDLTVAEGDDEVVLNVTRDELDAMSEWRRGDDGWVSN